MLRTFTAASVLTEAALLCLLASAGAADRPSAPSNLGRPPIQFFHDVQPPARLFTFDRPLGRSRHRFRLELEGARAQAQDWLHDGGFFLLEERDAEGRRSYEVRSHTLVTDWPVVRLRARVGQPQLAAGMRMRRNTPALGFTIPWQQYAFEFEGVEERSLGYLFLGTLRWADPSQRLQCGVAVPIAVGGNPSVGALLQIRMRIGQ
jgi:hypothetical protein